MSFTLTWIVSVILLLVSFFAIIFIAKFFTKPIDEYKFSFMRIFPFEVINHTENVSKIYSSFLYLFSGVLFTPFIVLLEGTNKLKSINPLSLIICTTFALSGIIFIFLHFFDVTHVKVHLFLFVLFAFLTLLSGALSFTRAIVAHNMCINYGNNEPIFIVCEVINAIFIIFTLIVILNPKLKFWARLEETKEGTNKYRRPKRFVLAYSEWALFICLTGNELLYFVQLLVK